jgi:hypothetical protein
MLKLLNTIDLTACQTMSYLICMEYTVNLHCKIKYWTNYMHWTFVQYA